MNILRRSLRGLSPIEARVDLQILQDSWHTAPGAILMQFVGLVVLGWMVRDWPVLHAQWAVPSVWLVCVWVGVAFMALHFRRHGINEAGYERWRLNLLWWHALQGALWGWLAIVLLGVAHPQWRVAIIVAIVVYSYTIMLVTAHDWAVSFVGSVPVLLLSASRLLIDQNPGSTYLALVMTGSLVTCVLMSRVVSRRLREGALLRHENADLVVKLREEINKVTQAKSSAETADKQKSDFFAAASHDLRQPLHVMMLLSSALKPHMKDAEGLSLLAKVQVSLSSLSTMFEKMFDVARIDAQRIEYKPQALPLAAMWARLDNEFSVMCEAKGLKWVIEPTHEWAQTDPHVLERILRNLLNNAVRYTEHGEIRLRARVRGAAVVCQVWDTGVGVPRELQHRIFEDYFQAANSARRSGEGLGLGLAVVRRLSLMGPTPIQLLSRVGRGSCFSVRLPRLVPTGSPYGRQEARPAARQDGVRDAAARNMPTPLPVAPSKDPNRRGVVMLIDDEPEVLDSTALILRMDGWKVASATTPDGALEALIQMQTSGEVPEGEMPVALLSDHRLGLDINGLEVLRNLRYEFGDDLPAILITGEGNPELVTQARDAGVILMHKPLNAEEMQIRLKGAVLGKAEDAA